MPEGVSNADSAPDSIRVMEPTTEKIDALVRDLVDSHWPTTESERVTWARAHGLPIEGERIPALEEIMVGTKQHQAEWHCFSAAWRSHQDVFVGVIVQINKCGRVPDPKLVADELRACLRQRWTPIQDTDDETGFTSVWRPDDKQVTLTWDTSGDEPGVVLLNVDHAGRAAAEEFDTREQPAVQINSLDACGTR